MTRADRRIPPGAMTVTSSPQAEGRQLDWRHVLLPVATLVPILALIFARMMSFELRRDEQMYAPPAVLIDQYDLYRDFFYNHVPGSVWLFSAAVSALGTDQILLAARLVVFGGWVALGGGIMIVSYLLTRSAAMAFAVTLLVLLNDTLLNQTGMAASNNLLPLPFSYIGLGLFLLGATQGRARSILIAASGISLGFAAAIKANAIGFIIPAAVGAFFLPREETLGFRIKRVAVPLALGGLVGSIPVLIYLSTDMERVLAHIVGFHVGPQAAYWSMQTEAAQVAVSPVEKAELAFQIWTGIANLFLLFGIFYFATLLFERPSPRQSLRRLFSAPVVVAAATLVTVVGLCFLPTPSFPQYFAPPIIAAALLVACLYGQLDEAQRQRAARVLLMAALLVAVLNIPRLVPGAGSLFNAASWTAFKVHKGGRAIADRLQAAGLSGKVATLAPIYPLEAGLEIYPELATGEFAYRSGDIMDAKSQTPFPNCDAGDDRQPSHRRSAGSDTGRIRQGPRSPTGRICPGERLRSGRRHRDQGPLRHGSALPEATRRQPLASASRASKGVAEFARYP